VIVRYLTDNDTPIIQNQPVTAVTTNSATFNGLLTSTGSSACAVCVLWGTNNAGQNWNWENTNWFNGGAVNSSWTNNTPFSTNIIALSPLTYYYTYGASNMTTNVVASGPVSVTIISLPSVTNLGAVARRTWARLGGQVLATGGETPTCWFSWWQDGSGTTNTVPRGTQSGVFLTELSALAAGTTYGYLVAASNGAGTVTSETLTFTTLGSAPVAWYAATNGTDGAWTNWTTAGTNLQTILDTARSNDTIHLAGHTFGLTNTLIWGAGKSYIAMKGGYAATNTAGIPGDCDPERWPTVLTRATNMTDRLLTLDSVTNPVMEGITFRGGYRNANDGGGGIYANNVSGLSLSTCKLVDNRTAASSWGNATKGGGLWAVNVSGVISNVLFSGNGAYANADWQASLGGGGYISGGALTFRDVVFFNNVGGGGGQPGTLGAGGALYFLSGSHVVRNALVLGNWGYWAVNLGGRAAGCGGIYADSAVTLTVDNVTFYRNNAHGLQAHSSAKVAVRNSIFFRNNPDIAAAGANIGFTNNLIGDASGASLVGANGNIGGDPLFDAEGYYLASGSPCTNAGDRSVAAAGLTGYTVFTNGSADAGTVSLGYHYRAGVLPYQDLYVATNGNDTTGDGAGWSTALRSMTRALAIGGARVRIQLAAGTYTSATETFPLTVSNRAVQVIGTNAALTTIDGGATKRLFIFRDAWEGMSRLSGVTIRNGKNTVGYEGGGGLQVVNTRLTVDGCAFRTNVFENSNVLTDQSSGGGALGAQRAELAVLGCQFIGNNCGGGWGAEGRGGAIYAGETIGLVSNCQFWGNLAQAGGFTTPTLLARGGAVFLVRPFYFEMRNCVIGSNETRAIAATATPVSGGGGVAQEGGRAVFRNLLIATNLASGGDANTIRCGGFYASGAGTGELANATIVSNRGNCGVYAANTNLGVVNSILWQNQATDFSNLTAAAFWYSRADGLTPGEQGNLTANPLFQNAATGIYELANSSPCKDAGLYQSWMVTSTDLAGQPRIRGGRVDMGAYESPPVAGTIFKMF
jgi:hypothetical protein